MLLLVCIQYIALLLPPQNIPTYLESLLKKEKKRKKKAREKEKEEGGGDSRYSKPTNKMADRYLIYIQKLVSYTPNTTLGSMVVTL